MKLALQTQYLGQFSKIYRVQFYISKNGVMLGLQMRVCISEPKRLADQTSPFPSLRLRALCSGVFFRQLLAWLSSEPSPDGAVLSVPFIPLSKTPP